MNKILLTLCIVSTIILGFVVFSKKDQSFGSMPYGQTAKYQVASSSTISFTSATRALATSTSRTRDYFRMQVVSGTAFCSMRNGNAATMSDYSFVLASTSPFFSMEAGVYQGTVSCTGTATISVVEANI